MTELTTAPTGAPLADADIFLVRKDGVAGAKKITALEAADYFGSAGGGGGGGSSDLYRFGSFFIATPGASEVLMLHVAADDFNIPNDFAGTVVDVGTNPSADAAFDVKLNGASIGTMTIASTGVVTLATTGGAVAVAAGDVLALVGPADAHGAAGVAFTFRGDGVVSGGGGGSPATRTIPTHVQHATLRNDGMITLGTAPTVGNLMIFVAGGFGNSLPGYVPAGFNVFEETGNGSANQVLIAFRVVEVGDTGSYAISASDNQAAVLYEFSDATGIASLAGGVLPFVNSTDFVIGILEPFVDGIRLIAMTQDNAANFAIDAATGLTTDFYGDNTGGNNHTSAFVRLDPATFVDPKVTGDITGWSSPGYGYWVVFGPYA